MKNIKFLFAFMVASTILVSCGNENATSKINKKNVEKAKYRDAEIKKGTASITFEEKEYDFGTVNEGDIVEKVFKITNSGKTDLVITNAQSTCGCTVPVWPKAPIKPGETGEIQVKFNTTGKPNRQQKDITLTTNTESGREVLRIKGSVIPKGK
ncbi:DUF1573 domain-containing protein [Polaribacter batillariae]|uniref:DUF1573 domain-containing protein n=1 Tax=Polaribacter batillariae TaxID=2808900 RepID=A0ABX7SVK4_9FLAO|nr:DUF1573 domain-containing protein [Polaribacter batillariae]QTD38287.1 DUF1573 domain-containing protein [Polaribacter batillariae]